MAIHQVAIEQIASPTEFKRPLLIDTDYLTNQWAVIVTCKRGAAQPREIQRGLDAGVEGDEQWRSSRYGKVWPLPCLVLPEVPLLLIDLCIFSGFLYTVSMNQDFKFCLI